MALDASSLLLPRGVEHFADLNSSQIQCGDDAAPSSSNFQTIGDEVPRKRPKLIASSMASYKATAVSSESTDSGSSSDMQQVMPQNSMSRERMEMFLPSNLTPGLNGSRGTMGSHSGGDDDGEDQRDQKSVNDEVVRMDLTGDLLHMIFSLLDHKTLCKAALVCRQWLAASTHEDFWKSLNFENCRITTEQVARILNRYPRVVEFSLPGSLADRLVCEALRTLENLEVLTLCGGTLNDTFFSSLTALPVLDHLSIAEAVLGSGSLPDIHIRHERLRRLQVTKCRVVRIFVRCPQLEMLSLKRSGMASAVLVCGLLRELDVSSCHKLSDVGVRFAVASCPLLRSLDISNCSYVSDETLREIAAVCTDLRVLDASYCPNISLEGVRMLRLTDMKLHNCEGINAASIAALSQCFMLEALQLDFCWLLTSVMLDLPRLRRISLVNCRKFVELSLRSQALVSINVTSCPILSRIDITSNALQKLVLQKQQSLTTVSLLCPCLREVDLTECESLTDSICEVFSDGGGCPMLSTLILDSCESLSMVKLNSTSLQTLSLVGCRAVTNLQLACPKLQKVYLDGCDHLAVASFCPVGLQSLNLGICPHLSKLEIEAPRMIVLELKGCGVLSEASINCPRLLSLDASFCSQLNDDCLVATTAACPLIESLILMSCQSIGPEGLLALWKLPNLMLLDVSYTFLTNLQPILDSCPQLKVIKLQACKYLEDTALAPLYRGRALPQLRELDLSYGSLSQSVIEELLAWCPYLTHVSLNGCANMHDLDWGLNLHDIDRGFDDVQKPYLDTVKVDAFMLETQDAELLHLRNRSDLMDAVMTDESSPHHSLQNLSCVGCINIRRVAIPASAHCVNLSSLNLSLSSNIQEVNLACSNLMTLNLSNCTALKILKLDCPRLTVLLLQACCIEEQELEYAIQSCSLLETLDVRSCPKITLTGITGLRVISPVLKRLFSDVPM